jgi:hypothetical protein
MIPTLAIVVGGVMRSAVSILALCSAFLVAVPSTAQDKVGVPACDEFLSKYESCVKDKAPAEQREAALGVVVQMRAGFKQVIDSNPGAKAQIEAQCQQIITTLKASLPPSYGCTF